MVYYALEGAGDLTTRIAAVEKKTSRGKGSAFAGIAAPIRTLTRIPSRGEDGKDGDAWHGELLDLKWELRSTAAAKAGVEYGTARKPIVIIDTFRHAVNGDEKSQAAVEFVSRCIELVKSDRAAHVILIHHNTKTGTDTSGHGAITSNTDHHFKIWGKNGKLRITCDRVKSFTKPAPITLALKTVKVGKTDTLVIEGPAKLNADEMAVINMLANLDDPTMIAEKQLREALDNVIPEEKTAEARRKARSRLKKALLDSGELIQEAEGVYSVKR